MKWAIKILFAIAFSAQANAVTLEIWDGWIVVHIDQNRINYITPGDIGHNVTEVYSANITSLGGCFGDYFLFHPIVSMNIQTNNGLWIVHYIATPHIILVGNTEHPPCGWNYEPITGVKDASYD